MIRSPYLYLEIRTAEGELYLRLGPYPCTSSQTRARESWERNLLGKGYTVSTLKTITLLPTDER